MWYKYNDDKVEATDWDTVKSVQGSMWIYSRLEPRQELLPFAPNPSSPPSPASPPTPAFPSSDESDVTHTPAHCAPHHLPFLPAQHLAPSRHSPSPSPTPQQSKSHMFSHMSHPLRSIHQASGLLSHMPQSRVAGLHGLVRPAVRRPSSATQFRTPIVKPAALTVPDTWPPLSTYNQYTRYNPLFGDNSSGMQQSLQGPSPPNSPNSSEQSWSPLSTAPPPHSSADAKTPSHAQPRSVLPACFTSWLGLCQGPRQRAAGTAQPKQAAAEEKAYSADDHSVQAVKGGNQNTSPSCSGLPLVLAGNMMFDAWQTSNPMFAALPC